MLESQQQGTVQQRAAEYLDGLTTEERRLNGQVYTPPYLVDFILHEAEYRPTSSIASATLLDPACGAGAFLERAVEILASHLRGTGADLLEPSGRARFLDLVSANIFGVDVDPQACKLAREAVRAAVLRASPGPLPQRYLARNIIEADFLTDSAVNSLAPVRAGGFSFIVGNPPYVSATRIDAAYKEELRVRFATATGRIDLYTIFMERSIALLLRGGRLALITPDKFLLSQTARALRDFILRETAVRTIVQFRSHKIFDNAATVPCITVLEREGKAGHFDVVACSDDASVRGSIEVISRSNMAQAKLTGAAWHIIEPVVNEVAQRLQGRHCTLASRTLRVSAGPATGRDGVYVLSLKEATDLGLEHELLRLAVRGRDLAPYRIDDPELRMIVPYHFDSCGNSSLVNLRNFPNVRRYLEQSRAELESRHCVRVWGKEWYDLHDQIVVDLARQSKILVPDVANSNRFAVDEGKFLPLHSVYYLIPKNGMDPYYLTAILNSRIAEFLIRLLAPVVKDGFSRYRQQFLARVPIPEAPPKEMAAIIAAAREGDAETADRLVTALFRPTDGDLRVIEQQLAARA